MWTHRLTGERSIGSAVDLYKRLYQYFSKAYLASRKTSHICNALALHGYSSFSLTILESIDILNLSKKIKKINSFKEQFFIDSLEPSFNIAETVGSMLGNNHSAESIAKMCKPKSEEHKASISQAMLGNKNPMHGKGEPLSVDYKAKISAANKAEKHEMFGRNPSESSKLAISITKGSPIFVFPSDGPLINTFSSYIKAAVF